MTLVFVSSLLSRGLGRSFDSIPFQQCVAHHKSPSIAQTKTNRLTPRGIVSLLLTAPAAPHLELHTLGRRRLLEERSCWDTMLMIHLNHHDHLGMVIGHSDHHNQLGHCDHIGHPLDQKSVQNCDVIVVRWKCYQQITFVTLQCIWCSLLCPRKPLIV